MKDSKTNKYNFNLKVDIHWSFGLLLLWVGFSSWQASGQWQTVAIDLLMVTSVFACVGLHEIGHALMARVYKIKTRRILILPIGGVAQLEKNPSNAKQEFWIALAGPMVNLIIVFILVIGIALTTPLTEIQSLIQQIESQQLSGLNTTLGFLLKLMGINLMLFIFNLLPAFPMDGGRILRALIEMFSSHEKATQIATVVGQIMALGFCGIGLYLQSVGLVIIGAFVFFSAQREKMAVSQTKNRVYNPIGKYVSSSAPGLYENQLVQSALEDLTRHTATFFLVLDSTKKVVGIIDRNAILAASLQTEKAIYISDLINTKTASIDANMPAEDAYEHMKQQGMLATTVYHDGQFIGVVELAHLQSMLFFDTNHGRQTSA